ncbi:unnamed protein product [Didymodactylos carnosus]|uniref:MRH domain-containing protein n=1 Tax=Didymodactylos carnosus TaxID=1234261 RepID=A0A814MCL7_9BILA|nr:unnamed protein product [Didymodactylos carnosus]CAF1077813.1 unnamed protein product [Didymodactylos carnosus]CAF3657034.1 unnamed protein product [Didymodactylos carnosus]CAF3844045.1 unnamed protein product [Didymodactylos carnosus]
MRSSFLVLIIVSVILNNVECDMYSCVQTFGSNTYDLNRLSQFTLLGIDDQYDYAFTPCSLVPSIACHGHIVENEMSCQYDRSFQMWSTMSFLDSKSRWPPNANATYTESPDGPGTGIVMTTTNGDPCFGVTRYMRIKFICDRTVEQPMNMTIVEEIRCDFHVNIRAAQACPRNQ